MADIGKLLGAVKLQLIIVIILGIIGVVLSYSFFSKGDMKEIVAYAAAPLVLGLVSLLVIVWAGYKAAKTLNGGAVDGGLAGAIIAVINGIISGVLSLAIVVPVMTNFYIATLGSIEAVEASGIMVGFGIIGIVVGIVIAAIIGFILGAIGGFIGRKK